MSKVLLKKHHESSGQSLIEVIIAIAIFVFIGNSITTLIIGSFNALTQGGECTQATALAQEGIEAVRGIQERAWNEIFYSTSSVAISGNKWIFGGEGTTETIGQYDRTISFDNICRDLSDDIISCPGSYTDLYTKKVTSFVDWSTREGINNTVNQVSYLTNWDSQEWTQTDWSSGSGQDIWSDTSQYYSSDSIVINTVGQISLISGNIQDSGFNFGTSASINWPFSLSANYAYDPAKITIINDYAKLITSGGSSSSGSTLNDEFSSNADNWTFYTWDVDAKEVTPTGSWQSSGGNPLGYINIDIPNDAEDDEVGGYWEQSISITEDGATVACYFDWSIVQWVVDGDVNDYQFYVFLDDFSGTPTIGSQIWVSGSQSDTTSWSGQQNIDCSSVASTTGTYYYKTAVWLDAIKDEDTGPITAGYDNTKVYWEKTTGGTYPTDKPSIYPTSSFTSSDISSWDSFTEIAFKDGGEVYYQLSEDDGSTWQYWNNSSWITAGTNDYNTASIINSNIGSFSTSTNQINFKAFLESDGSQPVQINNINIAFSSPDDVWTFYAWDVDIREVRPTGDQHPSGGNPLKYVDITVPFGRDDQVGGYWEQPLTIYRNNPTPTTIDFDYKIIDFNDIPEEKHIRVYLDSSSGAPTNQVGTSIDFPEEEGEWVSADQIDLSSTLTTAGTYYLKIAFWVETSNQGAGPFVVGFDNIDVDLGNGTYIEDGTLTSSSFNMTDSSPVQIIEWDETEPSNCDIELQLRTAPDSSGSPGTWTNWYGSSGSGSYFTNNAGTLISVDLNDNQWMQYRVELSTDGVDTPILKETRINYK